jgi:hypothetical protein
LPSAEARPPSETTSDLHFNGARPEEEVMGGKPQEREGAALALDHLHTRSVADAPSAGAVGRGLARRQRRASRRVALASFGLVAATVAVLLAGGAMFSSASGASVDPQANAVRAVGVAPALGPVVGLALNENVVGIAATPSGRGYWLVASDGGVFSFGDARFYGSLGNAALTGPIVGVAPTRSGHGYWLVAADGGVFSFGDARFHGSLGATAHAAPIVAMASTPSGQGYWLVGSDGGVFTFGDATFQGAGASFPHAAPVDAIARTRSGFGYYLLTADGGVMTFGDARFAGAAVDGQHLATSIAVPSSGRGYEIARTDGSVVGRGGAPSFAAPFDTNAARHPVVGIAARGNGGAWLATTYSPPPPPPPAAPMIQAPSQDPFLVCTRAHESDTSGGYHAVSAGGVYRGAYQFLRSTWNNIAMQAGRPDLVGVDPAAAAPADQDQLALFLYHQQGAAPWGGRCAGLP